MEAKEHWFFAAFASKIEYESLLFQRLRCVCKKFQKCRQEGVED